MVVEQMYPAHELARERQRSMLAMAASERQAKRVLALERAARRAERAQRQLVRSGNETLRLRGELAAEQSS
jgi:predicted RNA methylase